MRDDIVVGSAVELEQIHSKFEYTNTNTRTKQTPLPGSICKIWNPNGEINDFLSEYFVGCFDLHVRPCLGLPFFPYYILFICAKFQLKIDTFINIICIFSVIKIWKAIKILELCALQVNKSNVFHFLFGCTV